MSTRPAQPSRGQSTASKRPAIEICILAGGLSTRMGRDKSRLRLGGRTLLTRVREMAQTVWPEGLPVRVIRKDCVPRCGPLGGILTALKTSRADSVLFLACDMPLVSARLLRRLLQRSSRGARATFVTQRAGAGFPFLIPVARAAAVERQIARGQFSLQHLAATLKAGRLRVHRRSRELFNLNTPADLAAARVMPVKP